MDALATLLDENKTPSDITWLKYAVEDIKAFYFEAMTAQPGDYDSDALQHQFWQESSLGAAILAFHDLFNDAQQTQMVYEEAPPSSPPKKKKKKQVRRR